MTPPHTLLGEQIDDSSTQHNHLGCASHSLNQSCWRDLFHLIQRLLPPQSKGQDGEGEKDGVAKASLVSFFFNAKSYSVWGYCHWIRKCFVSFKLAKQMGDCVNPISVKCHLFHIYNYMHNTVSQGNVPFCIRFNSQNTYCLKLD